MDAAAAIEEHYPQLLRSAMLLCGDRTVAEDLTQETFLRALDSWNRFAGKSSRKTWLYGILLNVHRSNLRGKKRRWERILRWFEGTGEARSQSPGEDTFCKEWKESLWHAVSQLPTMQQQVIVLRFSDEMSYAEIADAMECPIGTVKSRINTALKRMQKSSSIQNIESIVMQD